MLWQVRGSTSPADEMAYIISKSDSCGVVVQDAATLERMLPAITSHAPSNGNGNGNGSGAASTVKLLLCPAILSFLPSLKLSSSGVRARGLPQMWHLRSLAAEA